MRQARCLPEMNKGSLLLKRTRSGQWQSGNRGFQKLSRSRTCREYRGIKIQQIFAEHVLCSRHHWTEVPVMETEPAPSLLPGHAWVPWKATGHLKPGVGTPDSPANWQTQHNSLAKMGQMWWAGFLLLKDSPHFSSSNLILHSPNFVMVQLFWQRKHFSSVHNVWEKPERAQRLGPPEKPEKSGKSLFLEQKWLCKWGLGKRRGLNDKTTYKKEKHNQYCKAGIFHLEAVGRI